MTEDDTFRILSRPTYKEMRNIWANSTLINYKGSYYEHKDEIDSFFINHGWSVTEYTLTEN